MKRSLLILIAIALVAAFLIACGSTAAEPTAAPATSTPVPTPTASIAIISDSPETDFDAFLSQIPESDVECFTAKLGEDRMKALALGEIELDEDEETAIQGCFSNEFVVGFLAGQIQQELGVFSGSSAACAASLLDDIPAGVLTELMLGEDEGSSQEAQLAIQGFTECLTQEELAALAASNADDESTQNNGEPQRYSSPDEQCMIADLGNSFADGYGELLGGGLLLGFSSAVENCDIEIDAEALVSKLEDTERMYVISDLEAVGFKKSKTYDIDGLESASSAHYGFYGIDPYNRLEYEARFYFSHEAAKTAGVEFANEATGAHSSLYEDDQRWKEGLSERRRCDSNGGHHVGRCGFPKYFDYAVAGNMVLLCQGKETLESLSACADLLNVIE
ncbi:DUF6810 family protein [Candidatus Lucifugimonas marina]|uniref:DUF6810 domain-containing protein n=1 Tax=Candidatus Lucifugimonas marina TaxID=3038979 RepID=A0AAJ5ZDI3_9CHLR|nr:hypothetical protein [SAR202 cluster bacterium JH702]MDG0869424.1 hypothetical protein [SAR202 cluster bacterium JH639]WFG34169.1 hypothetical protein GKN94_00195 [SAR202 cluster bacterium JH545]WFG38096.1 hypothetical protein GKO48_00195 [SAR202 cluster bacterium JH1073]